MPDEPLAEALGETLASNEDLPRYSVVAHWPGLARCTLDDEQKTSTPLQRAEHLDDPHLQYRFAVSPYDDRMAILHLDVCLHADDRELTGPEWAEVARRLARAAGILLHLADEARRIEQTLRLIPVRTELATKPTSAAAARLAGVLLLANENSGPLSTLRSLVGHTAHLMIRRPGAAGADPVHSQEVIARRLHGIGQDLDSIAVHLLQPRIAATPTAARHTAHRSL
ncbi:relaxase/mobilization nuclease [Streptomyces tauricus]|uniref:Relaxase/mobilization nuclease n=1 Tax=Streptomyces tauricus TaxID=68274 RepID=A0ABZ1JTL5_9ACTN|nr:relaxase/mobilization nuclease [Streptomyces tauricus]